MAPALGAAKPPCPQDEAQDNRPRLRSHPTNVKNSSFLPYYNIWFQDINYEAKMHPQAYHYIPITGFPNWTWWSQPPVTSVLSTTCDYCGTRGHLARKCRPSNLWALYSWWLKFEITTNRRPHSDTHTDTPMPFYIDLFYPLDGLSNTRALRRSSKI